MTHYSFSGGMIASLVVLASTEFVDPVPSSGRLGMITMESCGEYVVRLIASDTCGRSNAIAISVELQSPDAFIASITSFSARGKAPGEHAEAVLRMRVRLKPQRSLRIPPTRRTFSICL